jgi:hypothetical protein
MDELFVRSPKKPEMGASNKKSKTAFRKQSIKNFNIN